MGSLKRLLLPPPLLAQLCERRVTLPKHKRRSVWIPTMPVNNDGIERLQWATFIALPFFRKGDKVVHLKFHKTGQEKHSFNLPGNLITSRTAQE